MIFLPRSCLVPLVAGALMLSFARAGATDISIRPSIENLKPLWSSAQQLPEQVIKGGCSHLIALSGDSILSWPASLSLGALYGGLCLFAAGLPEKAQESFLRAQDEGGKAIQRLVEHIEDQIKEAESRRDSRVAVGQALSGLLSMLSAQDPSRAAQYRLMQQFAGELNRSQLQQLHAEIRALKAAKAPSLSETIRIPVVPIGGFPKHIVRVRSDRGDCTGSFVGPDLVLTNLHCVGRAMTVERDYLVEIEKYPVVRWWTAFGDNAMPPGSFQSYIAEDWAILQVSGTRSDSQDWLFVAKETPAADKIMLAGYSGDVSFGRYLTLDLPCNAQRGRSLFSYECSSYKGSSGAPVFSMRDPRTIIALNNSGRASSTGNAMTRDMAGAVMVERFRPTLERLMAGRQIDPPPGIDLAAALKPVKAAIERGGPRLSEFPSWDR